MGKARSPGFIVACFLPALTGFSAPHVFQLSANNALFMVDAANNAEIPFGTAPFASDSLAISPSSILYSADSSGNLWDITTVPIPVGPTGLTQIGDLVWANNGLWGFSGASSSLFFYDLGLNSLTYSAVIAGLGSNTITGVAYDAATSDIYLSGYTAYNNDLLFRVPSAATNAVTVGSMTISDLASYISDIEFDASGNLCAMSYFHRDFYLVNTSNAATTFLSTGPHRDTTAMAMEAVPEPATLLLSLLGMGTLSLARGKRCWSGPSFLRRRHCAPEIEIPVGDDAACHGVQPGQTKGIGCNSMLPGKANRNALETGCRGDRTVSPMS